MHHVAIIFICSYISIMYHRSRYLKYMNKLEKLNCNDMVGGGKFKIVIDKPKIKYVKYNGKNTIHAINTIDNENLNEFSEFMIGSITKVFTGMLITILNDKGVLNVNDSVGKYIAPNENNNFQDITIDNLICHTGGIIWYLTYKDIPSKYKSVNTSTEALEIFMENSLCTGEKGVKKYSSMGFIILGAIIEKVTKMSYMDALKHYILHPCKMYNTDIGEPSTMLYNNHKPMKKLRKEMAMEKYMVNAAGGLYSCVADMSNFAKYIPKILSAKQLNKCYGFYEGNTLEHKGYIYGGTSSFKVEYTNKWKIKNIAIECSTWTEWDY